MGIIYTEFREISHDISLLTEFRNRLKIRNFLFLKDNQSWHRLCNSICSGIRIASHIATRASQGTGMKKTNIESTLALAGALIVLIGVSAAASSALAGEPDAAETKIVLTVAAADTNRIISMAANKAAAEATDVAISSIDRDNQLDLDIRLLDRTSFTAIEKAQH
jgi:hypothetical protein